MFISLNCQAELYKSINEDGSVTYSDTPTPHAKPVTPPKLQSIPAVKPPPKPEVKADTDDKPVPYKVFKIESPENDATIHDNNGNIPLKLKIDPELQTKFKHQIIYLLDGKKVATEAGGTSYTFQNIDRGTHQLQAKLQDEKGKTLKSSRKITVYLKRQSKLFKQNNSSLWPKNQHPTSNSNEYWPKSQHPNTNSNDYWPKSQHPTDSNTTTNDATTQNNSVVDTISNILTF